MKHKKLILVSATGLLLALIVLLAIWVNARNMNTPTQQTISGRITNISNDCHVDGTCSVTLDITNIIITGCGLTSSGKTCKTFDQTTLRRGQYVEATVMGAKSGSGVYNLECAACTIRVTDDPAPQ